MGITGAMNSQYGGGRDGGIEAGASEGAMVGKLGDELIEALGKTLDHARGEPVLGVVCTASL